MTINMTIKAKNRAVVYDSEGARVPEDQYVTVPLSPSLVRAVKAGDLEEVESDQPRRARTRRQRSEATTA